MHYFLCTVFFVHNVGYVLYDDDDDNNNNNNNNNKEEKYASIGSEYLFAPIAVETLGPMNTTARQLFANLGRKISSASGDDREGAFLYQRVLVMAQRYNAVLIHDTLPATDCTD